MACKIGLLILSFVLAIVCWFIWKYAGSIYNAPGTIGDSISSVVHENFFSFQASGKKRLSCKFLPTSALEFIDAEHTAAINSEIDSYFEKREGSFIVESGATPRVQLRLEPIDQAHNDAIHTKTDLRTFEEANLRFMAAFFNLGYVAGPAVFSADTEKIRLTDLVFVKNMTSGQFQLTRDLKILNVVAGETKMNLRFVRGESGRLIPVTGTFSSPAMSYAIKFGVAYRFQNGVEIPVTIGTTILRADGSDSGPPLVDHFVDCRVE